MEKVCEYCKWLEPYDGVCTNEVSAFRGATKWLHTDTCDEFEPDLVEEESEKCRE